MMRRAPALCAAVLIPAGAALAAPPDAALPERWSPWRWQAPISIVPASADGLIAASLPRAIYLHGAPGLPDLRVLDAAGNEVPYVLHHDEDHQRRDWRGVTMRDVTFAPGQDTQAVLDAGAGMPMHNAVEITAERADFFVWVELSAGDDARSWRLLNEKAPIYKFSREGLAGNAVITYPQSTARYLRLRILDPDARFPLGACRVGDVEERRAARAPLEVTASRNAEAPAGETWLEFDLESGLQEVSEVDLATSAGEFHRDVMVRSSADGTTWQTLARAPVYRLAAGSGAQTVAGASADREKRTLSFAETRARLWRVIVIDGDDAPLPEVRATLRGIPRAAIFKVQGAGPWRAIYGNPAAEAPRYELPRLLSEAAMAGAAQAAMGGPIINTAWRDPAPWTERHPALLWVAVGTAVAMLALLALRSLRRPAGLMV